MDLRHFLVHSDLNRHRPQPGFSICNLHSCPIHLHTSNTNQFTSLTGQTYQIRTSISCWSSNVIYVISCQKCSQQYVGETGRILRLRIKEHIADIRHARNSPIATHFCSESHLISDFSFLGIEYLYSQSFTHRRLREAVWMVKLDTINNGLNTAISEDLLRLATLLNN